VSAKQTRTRHRIFLSVTNAQGGYSGKHAAVPQGRDQQDGMGGTGAIPVPYSSRLWCLRSSLVSDNASNLNAVAYASKRSVEARNLDVTSCRGISDIKVRGMNPYRSANDARSVDSCKSWWDE